MARICSFVFNSVSRDARVLKEANSLASYGHEVTVVGIQDRSNQTPHEKLSNGVEIVRVGRENSSLSKKLYPYLFGSIIVMSLLSIGAYFTFEFLANTFGVLSGLVFLTFIVFCLIYVLYRTRLDFRRIVRLPGRIYYAFRRRIIGFNPIISIYTSVQSFVSRNLAKLTYRHIDKRFHDRLCSMVEAGLAIKPDVVHCHDVHTLPIAGAIKRHHNCKAIYDAHEIYEEVAQESFIPRKYYRNLHNKNIKILDGFITINHSISEWYKNQYPRLPDAAIVMNATTRTPNFSYDGRLHDAAELPISTKILLYQGGFATKRGLEYIVRAAEHFSDDWALVMMGWGSLESHLMEIADEVNARRSKQGRAIAPVRFVPPAPQSELVFWTAGATIGIIPYENKGLNHWYCTPNKLWEYPNAGVPVLVSPFPELRKPVEKYGFGWLLPDQLHVESLAQSVNSLSDSDIMLARSACRTFVEENSWEVQEKALFSLYDSLLCDGNLR